MPHDFRNKSFQKVLRGYAPEEVEEYIAYLNEEYRKLERRTADSERKLALALKKLDENARNGAADSVGPAARRAAAILLKKAETEAAAILEEAERQADDKARDIVHKAQVQAQDVIVKAACQAEENSARTLEKTEIRSNEKAREIVHRAQVQAQNLIVKAAQQAELNSAALLEKAEKKANEIAKGIVHRAQVQAQNVIVKGSQQAEQSAVGVLRDSEQLAGEKARDIVHKAQVQAQNVIVKAAQQAEPFGGRDGVETDVREIDVKKAQETAKSIYEEINFFRDRLFAMYNEHLEIMENVTDAAQKFMDEVNRQADTVFVPETAEDISGQETEDGYGDGEEIPEDEKEERTETEDEAIFEEPEYPEASDVSEEEPEIPEEEPENDDELASNLAFMDRLFANLPKSEDIIGGDLYIDIPEDEEFSLSEDSDEDFPMFMIDWKKRSAVSALAEQDGEDTEVPAVDESDDFRSADGFDDFEDFEEESGDFGEYPDEIPEENYDDYRPGEFSEEAGADDGDNGEFDEEEEEAEEEEPDEFHDMDQIFNEDKSKREMSLTDEFNIIFDDSKSSQNVKEISRQPIVTPENPKNTKKHKKF